MAYSFFIDKMLLPVPPQKLQLNVKNQNKTFNLINGDEINLVNPVGLREYSFTILLPNAQYPFATYDNGFIPAIDFLNKFRELKLNMTPFQFIISRIKQDNKPVFDTNLRVSLEGYKVTESAKNANDIDVDITLKECPYYGTKSGTINNDGSVIIIQQRNTDTAPYVPFYTVQSGDSLWSIAKHLLNDGERYTEIYKKNAQLIDEGNKGSSVGRYTIHPGQILRIPT